MPQRATKLTRQKAAGISVVDSWCVARPRGVAHTLACFAAPFPLSRPRCRRHALPSRAAHGLFRAHAARALRARRARVKRVQRSR
jgi:hypothetical protein